MTKSRKVRVGRLMMKSYAAAKPVSFDATGRFVSTADAVKRKVVMAPSLAVLDDKDLVKLVLERNRKEPNFTLHVVGLGSLTKRELLGHIEARTEMGKVAIQAEINHVEELMAGIHRPARKGLPKTPVARAERIPRKWRWVPRRHSWVLRAIALFCENTTDAVTRIAAAYRKKHVHPVFKKRGFNVTVLEGTNDVRDEFAPRAKSRRVVYISGVGHGSGTRYTGHLNSTILEACTYDPTEVKGKSIHLLSCQTAKVLGPDMVTKGARSYAGYYQNFHFIDIAGTTLDERDLFWMADSTYDIAMAVGSTSEQATQLTKSAFNAAIAMVPGTAAATWLTWDRNYLRTPATDTDARYGQRDAKISPFVLTPFMELKEEMARLGV